MHERVSVVRSDALCWYQSHGIVKTVVKHILEACLSGYFHLQHKRGYVILGRLLKLVIEGNHGAPPVVFALGAVVTLARKDAGCACEVYEPNGDSMLNEAAVYEATKSMRLMETKKRSYQRRMVTSCG